MAPASIAWCTARDTPVAEAKWLPDGQSLVFIENFCAIIKRDLGSGTETTLYDVRTDTSRSCVGHVQTDQIMSLALSPDGRQLAFRQFKQATRTSALMVMDVAGDAPKEVATHHVSQPRAANGPSWSADGHYLLFFDLVFDGTGPDFTFELRRVSAAGGAPERPGLTAVSLYQPSPSPDGRYLVFHGRTRPTGGGVFAIDHVPGEPLMTVAQRHQE
jgi:Tol biopolymer transport system component